MRQREQRPRAGTKTGYQQQLCCSDEPCVVLHASYCCLQDASMRQREQRPRLTGLAPLHTYLADLMTFHIACLKTWVARRAGSSSGQPQHVPCIRHFLDWRPCNLLLLLYMVTCTAAVSVVLPNTASWCDLLHTPFIATLLSLDGRQHSTCTYNASTSCLTCTWNRASCCELLCTAARCIIR
jgi:hypothetical protein